MAELTKAQLRRQDLVDNAIHQMLNKVMEDLKPQNTSYGWNIEEITKVRDVIFPILKNRYYGHPEFKELNEMDFYPFIEEVENFIIGDYTECQSCRQKITWEEFGKCAGLCSECGEEIN